MQEVFQKNKTLLKDEYKIYWPYRFDLYYANGLIFKDNRIFVPKSLRKEMLSRLHIPHSGKVKTKLNAKQLIFWPSMNSDIDNLIESCNVCLSNSNFNQREPMIPHEIPLGVWKKVGTDIFSYNGKKYLISVDYYSKFMEVQKLNSETSFTVIDALKKIFSTHGIPDSLVSDNGPCFNSSEFKNFCKKWQFRHITTSPHYPQSNGQVERFVQTIKNTLKKCLQSGNDFYLALLELRNTPIGPNLPSPAQLIFSRRLKTTIPVKDNLLKPKIQPLSNMRNKLIDRQNIQKKYFDRNSKQLSKLKPGMIVKVKNFKGNKDRWQDGMIIGKNRYPRSYNVKLNTGNIVDRNRKHIIINKNKSNRNVNVSGKYKIPDRFKYDDTTCASQNLLNDSISVQESSVMLNSTSWNELSRISNTDSYESLEDSPRELPRHSPVRTRSGRGVRPPIRLSL